MSTPNTIFGEIFWVLTQPRCIAAAWYKPCWALKLVATSASKIGLSEKCGIFFDMNYDSTKSPPVPARASVTSKTGIDAAIRAQLGTTEPGRIFSVNDFAALGTRAAIDKVLSRLAASGELRRIKRGLYDIPRTHSMLGPLLPNAAAVAEALADKGSLRLQPSGAYAANLLGLSEQVPMKLVFLTDGASRTVQIGNQQIILRHTTPRNMANAGRISGLVIQALRYLKQPGIDARMLDRLRQQLSAEDKAMLLADAPLAPAWIAEFMRAIARQEGLNDAPLP